MFFELIAPLAKIDVELRCLDGQVALPIYQPFRLLGPGSWAAGIGSEALSESSVLSVPTLFMDSIV